MPPVKRDIKMETATTCVAMNICSSLAESELDAMSRVNRAWWSFVTDNRHRFPKKKIRFSLTRKHHSKEKEFRFYENFEQKLYRVPSVMRQEAQVHFVVEQTGADRHYGVCLRQFIPRPHNPHKRADEFDPMDLNQLAMDTDFTTDLKAVEDLEESLHPLLATISAKVDFRYLILDDPSANDLSYLGQCCRYNWTRVDHLMVKFPMGEVPSQFLDLLRSIRGCYEIKLIGDRASHLPEGLLECPLIWNASVIDIHLGHFSAQSTEEDDGCDDDSLCGLRADVVRIRGARLSTRGANTLIKQWIRCERGMGQQPSAFNITVDGSKFKKNEVLRDIPYEERGVIRDSYIVTRTLSGGRIERASVSFIAGRFTFDANIVDSIDAQQRLWF